MDKAMSTRGMALFSALLVTAFFAGCQDSGPTEVTADVDAQFAKGGNGGGGGGGGGDGDGGGNTPVNIASATGMIFNDAGVLGQGNSREIKFTGEGHVSSACVADGDDADCFWSELALQNLIPGFVSGTVPAACLPLPRKMENYDALLLLNLLNDAEQARFIFEGEVDRRRNTAQLRTDWYEGGADTNRYTYFVKSDSIQDNLAGSPQTLTLNDGVISMLGTGFGALECDWSGTITVAFDAP